MTAEGELDRRRRAGKPAILAVLPRGEAIRNFVYSRALDDLLSEREVVLATVAPSDSVMDDLRARYDRVHELPSVTERRPVRQVRSLLDVAHGRHIWSEAAQERWRRRDIEATTMPARARRVGWKALAIPLATDRGIELLSRLERATSRRFPPGTTAADLIDEERPALVFNGSHIHSAIAMPVVQAARWRSVPTATFLFSWDNLTSQGRLLDVYDHFLAWNEEIADHLLRMYPRITADQVTVTGTPQFDFHFHPENSLPREQWAELVGVDPDRPVVLYSTGMANHMPGEPEIVELVADQLAEMTDLGSPQLLVRVYAKDRTGRFDELRARRPDIAFSPTLWLDEWLTPLPADTALWTSTLDQVICGVNIASTVSLELMMFDKPVVNVAFNPSSISRHGIDFARYYRFDHYRPLVDSGALALATDPHSMRIALREAIQSPGAAAVQRRALLHEMFGSTLDGRSHERVSRALLDLAVSAAPAPETSSRRAPQADHP